MTNFKENSDFKNAAVRENEPIVPNNDDIEEFLHDEKALLSSIGLSGDVSLERMDDPKMIMGVDPKTKKIYYNPDAPYFKENGYDLRGKLFATGHELVAHVKELDRDPEAYLENFDRIHESGKEHLGFLHNIFEDAQGNRTLVSKLPFLEEAKRDIYVKRLFPSNDFRNDPDHMQFAEGFLREAMVPNDPVLVSDKARAAIDSLKKFGENEMDVLDIVTSEELTVKDKHRIMKNIVEPIFEKLREEDIQKEKEKEKEKQKDGKSGDKSKDKQEQDSNGEGKEDGEGEEKEEDKKNEKQKGGKSGDKSKDKKDQDSNDENKEDGEEKEESKDEKNGKKGEGKKDKNAGDEGNENGEGEENGEKKGSKSGKSGGKGEKEKQEKDSTGEDKNDGKGKEGNDDELTKEILERFKEQYKKFEEKNPRFLSPEDQKALHEAMKEAAEKRKKEGGGTKPKYDPEEEYLKNWAKEHGLDYKDVKSYRKEFELVRGLVAEMREAFKKIASRRMKQRWRQSRVLETEGEELAEETLVSAVLESAAGGEPRAFRDIERREYPMKNYGALDMSLLADISGSMSDEGKIEMERVVEILFMEALDDFKRVILETEREYGESADLTLRTEVRGFGDSDYEMKSLSPEFTEEERIGIWKKLHNPSSNDTKDYLSLEKVFVGITPEDAQAIREKKRRKVVVVCSDGASGNETRYETARAKLEEMGVIVVEFGMLTSERKGATVINDLSLLPRKMQEVILRYTEDL
ncbi:MAG: hypothetical protein WC878_08140 [Candidatus Paceibacterota bacterium]|jgi:hypothetical protein